MKKENPILGSKICRKEYVKALNIVIKLEVIAARNNIHFL